MDSLLGQTPRFICESKWHSSLLLDAYCLSICGRNDAIAFSTSEHDSWYPGSWNLVVGYLIAGCSTITATGKTDGSCNLSDVALERPCKDDIKANIIVFAVQSANQL